MRRFLATPFFVVAFVAVLIMALVLGREEFERLYDELDSRK